MDAPTALPHLVEMVVASTRYLGALSALGDDDVRAPSLLPDWSRAHVITHLARNADGFCNLLRWAETGVPGGMYDSQAQRDKDIEQGAQRSAHSLRVDAAASAGRLLQALNELDVRHEDALVGRTPEGPLFPAREIPFRRRVEVEVHHADLGLDFSHDDWDPYFADAVVGRTMEDRADGPAMVLRATDTGGLWKFGVPGQGPEVTGKAADLAWWVLGRGDGGGLTTDADRLPEIGRWR